MGGEGCGGRGWDYLLLAELDNVGQEAALVDADYVGLLEHLGRHVREQADRHRWHLHGRSARVGGGWPQRVDDWGRQRSERAARGKLGGGGPTWMLSWVTPAVSS